MQSLFIYVEFSTSNTKYTTNNILRTSFQNLNRNLYVNLKNVNFKFTMTTHLALLQNESANPQKIMLNTKLFQHFGLWAKNSNKMNNDVEQGEHVLFKLSMNLAHWDL